MRIRCLVPFCRHTRGDRKGDPVRQGMEWICGEHWMPLPKVERRVYSRARRRVLARWPEREGDVEYARAWHAFDRVWSRLKRLAIERALGIR